MHFRRESILHFGCRILTSIPKKSDYMARWNICVGYEEWSFVNSKGKFWFSVTNDNFYERCEWDIKFNENEVVWQILLSSQGCPKSLQENVTAFPKNPFWSSLFQQAAIPYCIVTAFLLERKTTPPVLTYRYILSQVIFALFFSRDLSRTAIQHFVFKRENVGKHFLMYVPTWCFGQPYSVKHVAEWSMAQRFLDLLKHY